MAQYYKHIYLRGPTRTLGYTHQPGGQSRTLYPDRKRIDHANYLQERFQRAWAAAKDKQAVIHVEREGIYLEFISEPKFDLALKSLDSLRSGIRLLNVQTKGAPENQQTIATLYVPNKRRSYFIKKIKDYAEKDEPRTKEPTPKNANLITRISDIKSAMLTSFWQDEKSLIPNENPTAIEVWLRNDNTNVTEIVKQFDDLLPSLNIKSNEGILQFPERSVKIIQANRNQLEQLIETSDDIAELRSVCSLPSRVIELGNIDQTQLAKKILEKSTFNFKSDVVICILDTGINNGHMLLKPVLSDEDLLTVRASWGTDDHLGHGTLMAGIAVYGDLFDLINSNGNNSITHRLESAKILSPLKNPKELWGYYTAQGLSRAEIQSPKRKRIACMAVTSVDDRARGRPSSWSAQIDKLASGADDDIHRLIIISAGNVDPQNWKYYPLINKSDEVHDPAQSWNCVTVGAYTNKVQVSTDDYPDYTPIAPSGGLSPSSTTSLTWVARKWPIKPEIVLEGGNGIKGPNDSVIDADDVQLISTYYKPQDRQFAAFGETSAATAYAARLAAQIQDSYPEAWPETIRALLVHSAEWTDAMKAQFLDSELKTDYAKLLRICGYGVPNLTKALYCASNSLTLISQTEIQPFEHKIDRYVTRDMHLYSLPWPIKVLSELGDAIVNMRITLSYFIEPGPGEIGWDNRYKYPSHGLRFEVNSPEESENEFIRRVNYQARDETGHPGTARPQDKWQIGEARNVGSIHSDIWKGTASQLAASNKVAIYPTTGWWKERQYLGKGNKKCKYSLIVSIYTSPIEVDVYTPVSVQINAVIPIEIRIDKIN